MANKAIKDLTRLYPEEMLTTDLIAVESGLGNAQETKRLQLGDLFYAASLTSNVSFASNTLFIDATTHQVSVNGSPSANTSDKFTVHGDTYVYGSIHATGHIVADGDLVLGDEDTDTITFNADIASNVIPDIHSTYYLGSDAKYWQALYTRDAFVKRDLDVQGDANVAGVFTVDSDFIANTDLFVDVSEHYARISGLRVGSSATDPGDNNLYVEGTSTLIGALNVTANAHFTSNVTTTSNVTVGQTLDVTANTDLHSWLNVDGNAQFSSNVNVTGNVTIQETLDVNANTDLHSYLNVDGETTFYSNVTVLAGVEVQNNVAVTGEFSVGANAYFLEETITSGNAWFSSNVNVTGNVTIQETLDVTANTDLHSWLNVDGNAQFSSNVNITGNVTIQETLDVTANTDLHSSLTVDGLTHLISNTTIDGVLTVNSVTELNDDIYLNAHNISGFTVSNGVGYFSSDYSRLEGLRVGTANTDPGTGNLWVEHNATIGNNLTITGNLYVEGSTTTIESTIVAIEDADFALRKDATLAGTGGIIITSGSGSGQDRIFQWNHIADRWELDSNSYVAGTLLVAGESTFTSNVAFSDYITGSVHFDDTIEADKNATFYSNVQVEGYFTKGEFSSNVHTLLGVEVDGNATFHSNVAIEGQVTGDATFSSNVHIIGDITSNGTISTDTGNSDQWDEAFSAVDLVSSVTAPTFLIGTSTGYAAAEIDNSINTGVEITWHPETGKLEFDAIPELQIIDNLGIADNWVLYDYDTQDNEGIALSANNLVAIAPHGHGRTYGVGTIVSGATHISNTALSVWGNTYTSNVATFGESPIAPTPITGTNDTKVATTEFVETRSTQSDELALALAIALG